MRSSAAIADAALGARQEIAQALQVGELPGRVLAGGAQQDVVGLVLAQHVVDQVGVEGHLPAATSPARDGAARSGRRSPRRCGRCGAAWSDSAIHSSRSSPSMSSSNSASSCSGRPAAGPRCRARSRWRRSPAAAAPCAPCAASAACPASGARCGPRSSRRRGTAAAAREALDQQPSAGGSCERQTLQAQPVRTSAGSSAMLRRVLQDAAHPLGEEGRERQAPAGIGRHLADRRSSPASTTAASRVDALEAQQAAGEDEGVARRPAPGRTTPRPRPAPGRAAASP